MTLSTGSNARPDKPGVDVWELDGTVVMCVGEQLEQSDGARMASTLARLFPGRRVGVLDGGVRLFVLKLRPERAHEGSEGNQEGYASESASEAVAGAGIAPANGVGGVEPPDPIGMRGAAADALEDKFQVFRLWPLRRAIVPREIGDEGLGLAGLTGAGVPGINHLSGEVVPALGAERVTGPEAGSEFIVGFEERPVVAAAPEQSAVDTSGHGLTLLRRLSRLVHRHSNEGGK